MTPWQWERLDAVDRHQLCLDGDYRPLARSALAVEQAQAIIDALDYTPTVRAIHYQRVVRFGVANSASNYKVLSNALANARWAGVIPMEAVVDEGRDIDILHTGECQPFDTDAAARAFTTIDPHEIYSATVTYRSHKLDALRSNVKLSRWWNLDTGDYEQPLLLIEKAAMLPPFRQWCHRRSIALAALRGQVSTSFVWHLAATPWRTVMVITDGDPTGENIATNAIGHLEIAADHRLERDLSIVRLGLTPAQGADLGLPHVPGKPGQYEMDAVPPAVMHAWIEDHLDPYRTEQRAARRAWQDAQDAAYEHAAETGDFDNLHPDTLAEIDWIEAEPVCGQCHQPLPYEG